MKKSIENQINKYTQVRAINEREKISVYFVLRKDILH